MSLHSDGPTATFLQCALSMPPFPVQYNESAATRLFESLRVGHDLKSLAFQDSGVTFSGPTATIEIAPGKTLRFSRTIRDGAGTELLVREMQDALAQVLAALSIPFLVAPQIVLRASWSCVDQHSHDYLLDLTQLQSRLKVDSLGERVSLGIRLIVQSRGAERQDPEIFDVKIEPLFREPHDLYIEVVATFPARIITKNVDELGQMIERTYDEYRKVQTLLKESERNG